MKKIWLWNHYAILMEKDQAGRQYWFSENLITKGYQPTIFCANTYHNSNDIVSTGSEKYIIKYSNKIPFVFVKTVKGIGNGIRRIANMLFFYKNLFNVSKSYAKIDGTPEIIIASSVHPLTMIAGIKIAKKFKIPCICEVRDLWPEAIFYYGKTKEKSILGKMLIAGEYWIYKNADALIFTKEGDTDYIREKKWDIEQGGKINLKKCYYINNGIDILAYKKSESSNRLVDLDLENNKFKIIYTGSIRPVNDVEKIVNAAKLLQGNSDIQFLIFGSGISENSLKKRVIDENINNVKFKGFVQRKFIPYILSKSSINLLNYSASNYNWSRGNSSNKLFEYMAAGKPIISTVKMGYSIINNYKCGLELDNGTPEELANAIIKISDMSDENYSKMGLNAEEGVKDFDFKVLTEKLEKIICSLERRELSD